MKISTILSNIKHGVGFFKGSDYKVYITIPNALIPNYDLDQMNVIHMNCSLTEIPESILNANDLKMQGFVTRLPMYRTYSEQTTMSFYLSGLMWEKHFFDDWHDAIINSNDNRVKFYDDYTSTIDIITLHNMNYSENRVKYQAYRSFYGIRLHKAYPRINGQITVGHTQGTDVSQMQITISYEKWERLEKSDVTYD